MATRTIFRTLLGAACAAVIGAVFVHGASFAAYPDRAIRIIVPFGPGSATDVTAREFGAALGKITGQPIVVDNRPGAEGLIGVKALMSEPADGYTLMLATSSITVLDPLLKANPTVDPLRDFAPVCSLMSTPMVAFITGALPFGSLAEFVESARANPEKYTYGYASSNLRLSAEIFQQQHGIKLRGVPYKTSGQSIQGVAAGEVDFMMNDAIGIAALAKAGKLRPLVVAADRRSAILPEVPAAPDLGKQDLKINVWYALYVNKDTPAETRSKLMEIVQRASRDPDYLRSSMNAAREELLMCGDAVTRFQASEMTRFKAVIERAAIAKE
ncbi:MAG: Bug family tripartite tricarboxylate transporter substrate binding protein [Lautropia sp.]